MSQTIEELEAELAELLATERAAHEAMKADWLAKHGAPFPYFSPSCCLPEPLIDLDNPKRPMVPEKPAKF